MTVCLASLTQHNTLEIILLLHVSIKSSCVFLWDVLRISITLKKSIHYWKHIVVFSVFDPTKTSAIIGLCGEGDLDVWAEFRLPSLEKNRAPALFGVCNLLTMFSKQRRIPSSTEKYYKL